MAESNRKERTVKKQNLNIDLWVQNQLAALAKHPDQHTANTLSARVLANAAKYRTNKPEVTVEVPAPPVTDKEDKKDELQK